MKYEYHTIFLTTPQVEGKKAYRYYEYAVDGIQFSRDLQETIHKMAESGYELFQTIPLISSQYLHRTFTEGVTVVFRKELG